MAQMASGGGGSSAPKPRAPVRSATAPPAFTDAQSSHGYRTQAYLPSPRLAFPKVAPFGKAAIKRDPVSIIRAEIPGRASKPKKSGGFGLASIVNPIGGFVSSDIAAPAIHALSGAGHVAVNLGKDIVNLPKSTIQGAEGLANAWAHDFLHHSFGPTALGQSDTQQVAHAITQSDPLIQAITGHLSRAAQLAEQHPLNALMDVTGAGGAVGRGIGAVGRAGVLGDRVAQATALARDSREAAPGIEGTTVMQHYSPNVFRQAVQKAAENHPGLQNLVRKVPTKTAAADLKRQVSMYYGPMKSRIADQVSQTAKALQDAKPRGKVEANVTPYFAGGFVHSADQLPTVLSDLTKAKAEGRVSGAAGKLNKYNTKMLQQAVAKPDLNLGDIGHASQDFATRQAALDAEKIQLKMFDAPEAQRAVFKQYAKYNIPGSRILTKAFVHPDDVLERQAAKADIRTAEKQLADAKQAHAVRSTEAKGIDRSQRSLEQQLESSRRAVAGQAGFIQGRHGLNDALSSARAQRSAGALERRLGAQDAAGAHLDNLKAALSAERQARKEQGINEIAAAKDALKDAKSHYALLRTPRKVKGLVVEDRNATPITGGKLKGQRLRQLTNEEIINHMEASGVDHAAHIHMTSQELERPRTLAERQMKPGNTGAVTGKPTTNAAVSSGAHEPGYNALIKSQLHDVRQIGRVRMTQGFLHRFGMKDAEGKYFTPQNWQDAATAYENQHGIKMEPVPDTTHSPDSIMLVPKPAIDEYNRHLNLETPSKVGRVGLSVNRAFRNTVLPFSPKLPIMHTVEMGTRAALIGAHPADALLARNVLSRLRDAGMHAEADRLEKLTTPGGLGGLQHRLTEDQLGMTDPLEARNVVAKSAHTVLHGYEQFAQRIIGAQRVMERGAQTAALGVHMRKTLQEWGHGWLDANTAVTRYVDDLARGYSNPALAEDAARYVHKTMGQYNNFTAAQKAFISRVSPFLPWYANAAKMIWHGLPAGHPALTTLTTDLAHSPAATQYWNAQEKNVPHDSMFGIPTGPLLSAMQTGPGHYLDVGRFTPFGLTDPQQGLDLVLPQYSGAIHALMGQDPFGKDFKGPKTPHGQEADTDIATRGLMAIDQLLGGISGPVESVSRSLEGQGSTLYNTSMPLFGYYQRKPGTAYKGKGIGAGFARTFNPLYGTYLKGKQAKSQFEHSFSGGQFERSFGGGSSGSTGQRVRVVGPGGKYEYIYEPAQRDVTGPQGGLFHPFATNPDTLPERARMDSFHPESIPAASARTHYGLSEHGINDVVPHLGWHRQEMQRHPRV